MSKLALKIFGIQIAELELTIDLGEIGVPDYLEIPTPSGLVKKISHHWTRAMLK